MSRKGNPFRDYLSCSKYRDPGGVVLSTGDRLAFEYEEMEGSWPTVTRWISGHHRWPVVWFPDANVALSDDTESVWDALRISALGNSRGSALISHVVEHELRDWLTDPWHHEKRARTISDALDNETWLHRLTADQTITSAVYAYSHLLGSRRLLCQPYPDGKTILGTHADNNCETMNAIIDRLGRRAQLLAKKGRTDAQRNQGTVNINDELHCALAIAYALQTGNDVVILTADEDFIEIARKAHWFIGTHYRAWLAAKIVFDGRYGEPKGQLSSTHGYFNGPLLLYRRPTSHLREVLPRVYEEVIVHVLHVAPDNRIRRLSSWFERDMNELLKLRARTGGRCTDLFGEANIHVDLRPLNSDLDGPYFGIGKDVGKIVEVGRMKLLLPWMDLEHAVRCDERHEAI